MHFWRFPQGNDTVLPGTPLKPRALSWSSDSQLLATHRRARRDGLELRRRRADAAAARAPGRPAQPDDRGGVWPRRQPAGDGYRDGMVHLWKPREHDQTVGVQPLDGRIESLAWGPSPATRTDGPLLLAASTAAGSLAVWVIDQRAEQPDDGREHGREGAARVGESSDAVPAQAALDLRAMPDAPPSSRRAPRPPSPRAWSSKPFVWAVVMGVLFGVPIYRSMTRRLTASPTVLGGLPAFTLTDQRGQPFGSRELAGKIWVADFIFTSCQGVCPLLSERMAEVGKRRAASRPRLSPGVDLGRSRARHARAAGRVRARATAPTRSRGRS